MDESKFRKFVGRLGSTHYVPLPSEIKWDKKDVVEIEIMNEKEIIVRKLV